VSPVHATLGGDGKVPADQLRAGQGGAAWGGVTGTLSDQTDLDTALGNKVDTADSRLSDARTPLTHAHAAVDITGTAVVTNDARLSDSRTPLSHSHTENILHSLATASNDFLVSSGASAFVKKTLAEVKTILGLATDYLGLHAKADTAGAADTAAALATGADRTKLDGIAAGAQANADITKAEIEAKLTGAISSHSHAGGAGGGLRITFATPVLAALVWTNMPAALSFLFSTATIGKEITKADLTNFTQCRLLVNKQGTSGAAASKLILRYRTAFNQVVANYSDIGASEVSVAVNVNNTFLATNWINLAAGAKADVFIAVLGSGGDGALDPAFGQIAAEFK
jgi:hypothetical protein